MRRGFDIVWFKRDLRVSDHEPLRLALLRGRTLALYVFEPTLVHAPDCSAQHIQFAIECLNELRANLFELGVPLILRVGEVPDVLEQLHAESTIRGLWSHEETGNLLSYRRDIAVRHWCKRAGVPWRETPSNGVVRRLATRDHWGRLWLNRMSRPPGERPEAQAWPAGTQDSHEVSGPEVLGVRTADKAVRQLGGRRSALDTLRTFFADRGRDYRSEMSSPLSAADACSRLSPYLAYGCVSVREVLRALNRRQQTLLGANDPELSRAWVASLRSFESRLHWRCHFIQKLESQPDIEWRNLHSAHNGVRPDVPFDALLNAWTRGETGYPMIDACMRMLAATGWINFRMRAMLVSFATVLLWRDWRAPALHLAREFLDYEPGIHYPQIQMQSGTTGINTIRIYNPVKQAKDQDPQGEFVRRWIPALKRVPQDYIFEPWTMPNVVQTASGCRLETDYPAPIVDFQRAREFASRTLWSLRKTPEFQSEAERVYCKHGSRSPKREPRRQKQRRSASNLEFALQLSLFGDSAIDEDVS